MIEDAEQRLRELKHDEWSRLGLAAVAMGLALGATVVHPPLAVPFVLGSLLVCVLAGRAFFERLDLTQELLRDRDAYLIPEIRCRAEKIASLESRRLLAGSIRRLLTPLAGCTVTRRVAEATPELEALAGELEDDGLVLDPARAVQCSELVEGYADSPLHNELVPVEDLHVRLRQIRSGFEPRNGV